MRFSAETRGAEAAARERVTDKRRIAAAVLAFRREVEQLYASQATDRVRAASRAAAETRARASIAALSLVTRDPARLASEVRLSDACLALTLTYAADVDGYAATLASLGGELPAFVARLRDAAGSKDPRAALLSQ